MAKTEKKQTTDEILLAIYEETAQMHKTLGEGLLAIQRALLGREVVRMTGTIEPTVEAEVPEEKPEPEDKPVAKNDVPKFLRDHLAEHPETEEKDLMETFKVSPNMAKAAVTHFRISKKVKTPPLPETLQAVHAASKEEKVTVEKLRAKISEFAEAFSMNEALAVNEQFGGSRKVSGIPEVAYEKVFNEMTRRLAEKAKPAEKGEAAPTIDDVRKAAQPFVDKNGDPAFRALLKAVGKAEKISGVDPKFYPALIEALTNA